MWPNCGDNNCNHSQACSQEFAQGGFGSLKEGGKYAKTNNLSDVLCVLLINSLNTADYQQ